ncbi:MAG: YkgJ family cysteine cluster protein [Candidatus Omnitrophica bacterium]|nr:YkgJ family cysteine cluster protein [Candidatus Omnitrophota bacterium]
MPNSTEIDQIIPRGFCLRCDICCRFLDRLSAMRPYFLNEEIAKIEKSTSRIFKKNTGGSFIKLVRFNNMYICPYFNFKKNICSIYKNRPFDCRLYPLLLMRKDNEVFLCADLNCPFIKENLNNEILKNYAVYLKEIFAKEKTIKTIARNKKLIGNYVQDVVFFLKLSGLSKNLNDLRKRI